MNETPNDTNAIKIEREYRLILNNLNTILGRLRGDKPPCDIGVDDPNDKRSDLEVKVDELKHEVTCLTDLVIDLCCLTKECVIHIENQRTNSSPE